MPIFNTAATLLVARSIPCERFINKKKKRKNQDFAECPLFFAREFVARLLLGMAFYSA